MKSKLSSMIFLLILVGCKTGPNHQRTVEGVVEIVRPDYGILPDAYRNRSGLRPLMWRCFSVSDVRVKYREWRDSDPLGYDNVIVTMCDFEISVVNGSSTHLYHGRRGKPIEYCHQFRNAWDKLTQGERYICIDGETLTKGQPQKDEASQKMIVSWTWDKIATKKGCYSFWDSYDCKDF